MRGPHSQPHLACGVGSISFLCTHAPPNTAIKKHYTRTRGTAIQPTVDLLCVQEIKCPTNDINLIPGQVILDKDNKAITGNLVVKYPDAVKVWDKRELALFPVCAPAYPKYEDYCVMHNHYVYTHNLFRSKTCTSTRVPPGRVQKPVSLRCRCCQRPHPMHGVRQLQKNTQVARRDAASRNRIKRCLVVIVIASERWSVHFRVRVFALAVSNANLSGAT